MKSSVTSIALNGILSNDCNTDKNHDSTTEIQLVYENINMNLISNAVCGSCAIDDYIDITDNTLINEINKNSETSKTTSTNQNPSLVAPYTENTMGLTSIHLLKMRLVHWYMMRLTDIIK